MKFLTKEVQIALVAIVGIVVLFFGLSYLKGLSLFSNDNIYYIKFNDVGGLSASSPVYARGLRVGTVKALDFDFEEGEDVHTWHVNASNRNSRMELVLYCKRDEMMLFNYEAPDGQKRHNRLWNGGSGYGEIKLYKKDGTLIDHVKIENAGCEYGEYDR